VYQGNIPDVTLFPQLSKDMIARYRKISDDYKEATMVFDRGNSSKQIQRHSRYARHSILFKDNESLGKEVQSCGCLYREFFYPIVTGHNTKSC
jgi:hypothetical protein